MTKLDDAVQKIIDGETDDPWTNLCVETVRLGAALARWENAKKRYVVAQKVNRDGQ